MDPNLTLSLLTNVELALWLAALAAALRARLYKTVPAVLYFVAVKLVSVIAYLLYTRYAGSALSASRSYALWFDFYWVTFFAATLAAFFSLEQIVRHVLVPLEGLAKLAVLIFRCVGVLTFFTAATAHVPEMRSVPFGILLDQFCYSIALCMALFEVSLVSVLVISAHRLGLSLRTRIFGLSAGFCVFGIMDLLSFAATNLNQMWSGLALTSEIVIDATLLLWIAYLVAPDRKRGAIMLKRSSKILRWDEVVKRLGVGPHPDLESAPSFMTDVENVVERIMLRRQASGGSRQ